MTALSQVAQLIMGQSPPSISYNIEGSGLPFLQGKAEFGPRHPIAQKFCTDPRKIAEPGDILLSVRAPVGPTNVCQERMCIGRGLAAIRATKIDPDFLLYNLQYLEKQIAALGTGSTFQAINKAQLSNVDVNAYGFGRSEQSRIAFILACLEHVIETQVRIIATTTELKKALMQKLFTEGLRNEPQKRTEIGLVPESWDAPTVESVCMIKASAMTYKQLENAVDTPGGTRVIGVKVSDMNLPGNEIEFRSANLERVLSEEEAKKRTVPPHSVVFPKRGAAISTNKKRLTISRTVLDPNLIAVTPSKAVNHRYLFHWFNTFDLKKITDPGPTPQLNKKDIAPLKFPLPPVAEQEAIAEAIDAVESKTSLHLGKRDLLQDLFRTLLHQLMTAQIRVNELDLSDAEKPVAA